ncbi:hypothetical protein Glove_600g3 [Diversispora epigaea]|uniref:HMG box domain-containing protein n=1 Tax=Diversispora epigaea TaxID=1348612 RepID=A0A397G7H6_9GLOM|nr:hypothetical protein Glove_600g3 [Diversispora epigaea]
MSRDQLQLQSQPFHNHHEWIIVDESSSIASPNQRNNNNRPLPSVPLIKVPFPPNVNPEELIIKPRKAKAKLPTKPPNAFMIYRMQYVKELHARDHRLPMRSVSSAVASSWRGEPEHVVEHYEVIAKEASRIYNQKFPKPPSPQKSLGVRQPQRRNGSSINMNMSDITNQPLVGSVTQIDNSRSNHFPRYYSTEHHSNRSLTNSLGAHSSLVHNNNYPNNRMHSSNVQNPIPIPSVMDAHYSSNILERPSMLQIRSLSNSYPTTNTNVSPSTFHMPSLPHVHSLTTAPFHYMDEWDFTTPAHA